MESHLEKNIKTIIKQFPGFICWKNTKLFYEYMNKNLVKLIGYKEVEQVINLTDFDVKGRASEYAEIFRKQDKKVLTKKLPMKTLDIMEYCNNQFKILITNRLVLYDEKVCIGLITQSTEINDLFSKNIYPILKNNKIPYNKDLNSYEIISKIHCKETKLTARESECLFYIIRGKSAKEIGKIINLSPRTVENYIDNIKSKFNCYKKSDLVDKAVHMGYQYHIPQSFLMF